MRKLLLVLALMLVPGVCLADDPPTTVTQDPRGFFDKFGDLVQMLDPDVSAFHNWGDGDWYDSYTITVFKVTSKDHLLGSWRLGGAGFVDDVDKLILTGPNFNLVGLTQRYVPDWPIAGPTLKALGKYTRVAFLGGRNLDDHEWAYGFSAGIGLEY